MLATVPETLHHLIHRFSVLNDQSTHLVRSHPEVRRHSQLPAARREYSSENAQSPSESLRFAKLLRELPFGCDDRLLDPCAVRLIQSCSILALLRVPSGVDVVKNDVQELV